MHYHLRPGGVRRVIELYAPSVVQSGGFDKVALLTGEIARDGWTQVFRERISEVPLEIICEPALRYLSEQQAGILSIRRRIHAALHSAFANRDHDKSLVWVHNPGLARNPILAEELTSAAARTNLRILAHHHDFWFENRWKRWPDLRRAGYRTVDEVAPGVFLSGATTAQATVNSFDRERLLLKPSGWLPNPVSAAKAPSSVAAAQRWLERELGDSSPVWISPTRLLRRKNLAEAVFLTRLLRPGHWFISTAGVSSRDEQHYARRLQEAAKGGRWKVRFGILADHRGDAPAVDELVCASEAVLLTSVQEGFGLPFVESMQLGRPLIARSLPNVQPDLDRLGVRFPHLYEDLRIPPALFNYGQEVTRQRRIWSCWTAMLPPSARRRCAKPPLTETAGSVPFSRLSLDAQFEVLSHPPEEAFAACLVENPWLEPLRTGKLKPARWPSRAARFLHPDACAKRLLKLALRASNETDRAAAITAQTHFLNQRLDAAFLYPILMEK